MAVELKSAAGAREREIFLGALESAPAERASFLQAACGEDQALRQRVEALLQEQEQVGSFLETPALAGVQGFSATARIGAGGTELAGAVTEKPGDRIGRYKLLQKIGEGGCGVVYMAEQEEPVRRRVALKVIKLGMDTKSVIARFEVERQALAMMDHPNIAKVLDAGATETGRPFFVMELVRGIRITEYCDQNNIPTEQRLGLFIQVCHAIQHAHQKGIIHRDIKPSNILITLHDSVPVPKVIDFGIAKATEQRLTQKTLFTEFTAFIGTPAYMSPEQAEMSGLDIDTRSDIYSLGVLLYELLTGKTPFDAEALLRGGLDECRRTIREKEPVRPSTRVATMLEAELTTTAQQRHTEPPRLIHSLRGDLDWIVMKCLEKDRTRRYDTSHDVVLDVQRYLDNEPVLARPPSNVYRLQKILSRHRGAFAAAAAIAVTLLGGITISTWQAVRATRAEHRAESSQKQEIRLRRFAELEKGAARLNEYIADINLAERSFNAENLGRAVQLLNKHRPEPGAQDLRGFEWRYLWQLCQGDEHLSFPVPDAAPQSLALSPDGNLLALGVRDSNGRGGEKVSIWNLRTQSLVKKLRQPAISAVFLPDGKRLITSHFFTIRVWRTSDWAEETSWSEPGEGGHPWGEGGSKIPSEAGRFFAPGGLSIAVSPDGKRLASSGREGVHLSDLSSFKKLLLLTNASGPMIFSPDGKRLATDSKLGISLWPLEGTGPEVVLESSTNLFLKAGPRFRGERTMAFSPDGKFFVAARNSLSERGVFVLSIWDAQTGRELNSLPDDPEHIEHTGVISSLAFAPDGNTLATASMDHSIRLWDFAKRRRVGILLGNLSEVWAVAFTPDGQQLVSAAKDGSVSLWPLQPQQKEDLLPGAWQPLAFSKDGRTLAALNREGLVNFINVATREPEQQFQLESARFGPGPEPMRFGPVPFRGGVSLSADFSTLAQPLGDGSVKIWTLETHESSLLKVSRGPVEFAVLSPDGRMLVTGGRLHTLRCWDLGSGTNTVLSTNVHKVLFSPDGRTLAAFGRGDSLELWDFANRSLRTNLAVEAQLGLDSALIREGNPMPAAFSPNGKTLAVVCSDDTIRLLDTMSARLVGTFTGHKQSIYSVAFSPDGKTLASASEDSTLKLWNVATQQELFTNRRLGGAPRGLMFSPDGRLLIGASGLFSPSGGLRFYRAPLLSEIDLAFAKSDRKTEPADAKEPK